jgi:hypothetical protein
MTLKILTIHLIGILLSLKIIMIAKFNFKIKKGKICHKQITKYQHNFIKIIIIK